ALCRARRSRRDRLHRSRHLRRSALRGPRRSRDRRRSGCGSAAAASAVSPHRRRTGARARRRARARRAYRRGAARARHEARRDPRPAREGHRVSAFERADDGTITLIGGSPPTSGKYPFPLLAVCPYSGATDVERVELSRDATLWAWTAVTAAPPGYEGAVPY